MRLTARSPQPDEARGLLRLAQELAQQGDYTAALAAIERAMRSGADEYTCYLHIAALERQRHRADAAILALQHAIELQPNRSDAREKMAELYLESGQVDAAIEQATHVLRRDPDNITIRPLLVAAHLEKGDWEAALRVLDELIARAPTEPIYHFHQAQVFQELGQWGLALIAYDRVVELGTDRELVERAQEAMAMLDRIQIEHVLTLVLEDPQFRRAILENLEEALVERQFALSRPGMTALRILLHQLQERELPCKPTLYH
ncbi:MAG: tetratricopeptide repeat protein [Armatimonadota bacterium]|nr:tetratricopeptide repeat protein [Armatimonadota bacterium]MDW8104480.1 tetratricopeptide repeat protein [Armatimonadota bacterium]